MMLLPLLLTTALANQLHLDEELLLGAAETVVQSHAGNEAMGPLLPLLDDIAAQQRTGGGNTGGGASGPPMLTGVGIGVQVGFPTALVLKLGKAQQDGFAFGVGARLGYYDFLPGLWLHGDYQFHLVTLVRNPTLGVTFYIAPGLALGMFGSGRYGFLNGNPYVPQSFIGLAGRLNLGASLLLTAAPIEIYLELTPTLWVFPVVDPDAGWSLGFRYYL